VYRKMKKVDVKKRREGEIHYAKRERSEGD